MHIQAHHEVSLPQILIDLLTKQVSGSAGASASVVDLSVLSRLQISPIGVAKVLVPAHQASAHIYGLRHCKFFLETRFKVVQRTFRHDIGFDDPKGNIGLDLMCPINDLGYDQELCSCIK